MTQLDLLIYNLPKTLRLKTTNDSERFSKTLVAISEFKKWFDASALPFFPDYTDHTFAHAMDVFTTAIDLIPEESYDVISNRDICVLLASCACHDAGMHITEKQFVKLIALRDPVTLAGRTEPSWEELWADYMKASRRFNDHQLRNIFGDTAPARQPPSDEADFTKRDRLLIGEFLRRHHPRLAHEIARGTLPTIGVDDPFREFDLMERDLIGLIARSHGDSLRTYLDYLQKEFDLRDFQGIHAVYIMALLRIADYAQIQAARAPLIRQRIHSIRSPISQREWRVHNSIKNINYTHDDPEAVFVYCKPSSIGDLTRAKDWLLDVQRELDLSWAILGEVYGRQENPPLNQLKLKIRRMRSTIFEEELNLGFVPEAFSFKVAEAEMLSLLLSPLYGDHPLYGVRELVQNARDASMEKRATGGISHPVVIKLSLEAETGPTIQVKDDGVGMTLDTIRSYFLNAGASFRSSSEWREKFTDDLGKSKVVRTGRFGVGALAAFLLGDKIRVETRHHEDKTGYGYQFECCLSDTEIQIEKAPLETGTRITVYSSKDIASRLIKHTDGLFEAFSFEKSELIFDKDGDVIDVFYDFSKSIRDSIDFHTSKFPGVTCHLLSSIQFNNNKRVATFVNGIFIGNIGDSNYVKSREPFQDTPLIATIALPGRYAYLNRMRNFATRVDIQDPDGVLHINLARTAVTRPDPEITSHIDAFYYKKFMEDFVNAKHSAVNSKTWKKQTAFFEVCIEDMIVIRGEVYPNDLHIAHSYSIEYICRIPVHIADLKSLSLKFPSTGFVVGTEDHSDMDTVNFMRDLRSAVDRRLGSSGMTALSAGFVQRLINSRECANWMRELVGTGIKDGILCEWGSVNEDMRALHQRIATAARSTGVELFADDDKDFRWQRWVSHREAPRSIVGSFI